MHILTWLEGLECQRSQRSHRKMFDLVCGERLVMHNESFFWDFSSASAIHMIVWASLVGLVLHCPGFSRTMIWHESSLFGQPPVGTASFAHGIVDALEETSCCAAHGFVEVASF